MARGCLGQGTWGLPGLDLARLLTCSVTLVSPFSFQDYFSYL